MEAMGRQPEASGKIQTAMIIGCAFIEALTIYVLISVFLWNLVKVTRPNREPFSRHFSTEKLKSSRIRTSSSKGRFGGGRHRKESALTSKAPGRWREKDGRNQFCLDRHPHVGVPSSGMAPEEGGLASPFWLFWMNAPNPSRSSFAEMDRMKSDAEKMQEEYKSQLQQAHAEARELVQKARGGC